VSGLEWVGVGAAVVAAWAALEWAFRPRRRYHFLDGVQAVSMWRARFRAWKARLHSAKSIQFGLWLPVESLVGSFLILATSRAGKTVLLNLFRKSLLPLFADPDESVLVIDFDPKRDNQFWAAFLPPAVPFLDLSPSVEGCGIDLFGDAEHDGDLVTVADAMLPEVKNDHQPHFRNTAVNLLTGVLRAARWHAHRLTLRDVILVGSDLKDLRRYLRACPLTASLVTAHLTDGDEAMSVFSTLASGLNRYRTVAAAWSRAARQVTVAEFLSFPKAVLNLPYEDDAVPVLTPILRLILLRLEQKVLKQNKKGRRVIFLLDEFRILHDVRVYLLACKGAECGVSLFYAAQSKVGAATAHGEDTVKELFGLAKNRLVLRLDGYDDALFASHMLGKSHGYLTLLGKGGPTESAQGRDVADPSVVQNLPLPSPRDPVIRGFGNTPDTGPFHFEYRFGPDLAFLNAAKSVPRLPARPAAHFDLQPLSPAERRRLGLR
jgi:hypothetical protein